MTTLSARVVNQFFDRAIVVNAIDKAKRKQLSKAGAFVRTTARRSIKPAGKRDKAAKKKGGPDPTISQPGQPPRLHTSGKRNLKLILFAWEPVRKSVVVGPMLFKTAGGVRVPEVLEHGGVTNVKQAEDHKAVRVGRGVYRLVGKGNKKKAVRVRARPFMAPALRAEAPKFPDLFANSVKP